MGLLNVVFAAHTGLWGVLVIDMIQFFVKMSAVIAAAYFAVRIAREVGGLTGWSKSSPTKGTERTELLGMLPISPTMGSGVAVFIMPIAVQWWAVWYRRRRTRGWQLHGPTNARVETEKDAPRRRTAVL